MLFFATQNKNELGKFNTRLVRTESNYYHNQIDLRAYEDKEIDKYRYLAVLDNRKSDICQELDGQVFEV